MRGMGNMQGMMKQMQKMQKEMGQTQEVLNSTEFVGQASDDMVVVTMTGDKKMKDIAIKPEAMDPEDPDMLQDLIIMQSMKPWVISTNKPKQKWVSLLKVSHSSLNKEVHRCNIQNQLRS